MLWTDPWVQIASATKTHLPPPPPRLPPNVTFQIQTRDTIGPKWATFVGTHFSPKVIHKRLEGCSIPCLYREGVLVATCVFRPHPTQANIYMIETLVARPQNERFGGHLLHSAVYETRAGYVFTWEVSLVGLIACYWKGWLASMVRLEYGWINKGPGPARNLMTMPFLLYGTWFSDSGINDGFLYAFQEGDTMTAVPAKSWTIAKKNPGPGWVWNGNFVVTGNLNIEHPIYRWFTPEITSS